MDYKNSKIYKIVNDNIPNKVYYGSTCSTLTKRLYQHKRIKDCTSKILLEKEGYQIILVESFECNNKDELRKKERWYIENNECVNKQIPGRTRKEYRLQNKEKIKKQRKEYELKNKDKIKEHRKEYELKNKEKIKERHKEYYLKNKEKILKKDKEYRVINKEKKHNYYVKNKEKKLKKQKEYYLKNKEKILKKQNERYQLKKSSCVN